MRGGIALAGAASLCSRTMFGWRGVATIVGCAALACGGPATRELKVSAAMSLKEVFAEIEAGFEAAHPGAACDICSSV